MWQDDVGVNTSGYVKTSILTRVNPIYILINLSQLEFIFFLLGPQNHVEHCLILNISLILNSFTAVLFHFENYLLLNIFSKIETTSNYP